MKKPIFITMILLLALGLATTGCSKDTAQEDNKDPEQVEETVKNEEKVNVDDQALTDQLKAEKNVKDCAVVDQGDVVAAHITFETGTDDATIDSVSNKAWKLIEEKYPDRTINVTGQIAE